MTTFLNISSLFSSLNPRLGFEQSPFRTWTDFLKCGTWFLSFSKTYNRKEKLDKCPTVIKTVPCKSTFVNIPHLSLF